MPFWHLLTHFAAAYLPDSCLRGKQLKGETGALLFVACPVPNTARVTPPLEFAELRRE